MKVTVDYVNHKDRYGYLLVEADHVYSSGYFNDRVTDRKVIENLEIGDSVECRFIKTTQFGNKHYEVMSINILEFL